MIGHVKLTRKLRTASNPTGTLLIPISLPKSTWTEVARITEADLLGPLAGIVEVGLANMGASLYGSPPLVKPTVVEARWVRHPEDDPDPTGHTALVMNPEKTWEATVPPVTEYLTHDDFPLVLFAKQNGSAWGLHTVIATVTAPTLFAAARLLSFR